MCRLLVHARELSRENRRGGIGSFALPVGVFGVLQSSTAVQSSPAVIATSWPISFRRKSRGERYLKCCSYWC